MNPLNDISRLYEQAIAEGQSREEAIRTNFGVEKHMQQLLQSGNCFINTSFCYAGSTSYRVFYYRGIINCTNASEFYSGGCEVRQLSTGNRQFVLTKYADTLSPMFCNESEYEIIDDSVIVLER